MAFDGVFVDKSGEPFAREIAEVLETCVTDFLLEHTDADPNLVVKSAVKVAERAGYLNSAIRHLYRYAKTVIRRDIRHARRADLKVARMMVTCNEAEWEQAVEQVHAPDVEQEILVADALATLTETDRQLLWLHCRDYEHADIAAALNITVTNSRQRLARAKRLLRQHLAPIAAKNLRQGQ